jgi:hypothetical protein
LTRKAVGVQAFFRAPLHPETDSKGLTCRHHLANVNSKPYNTERGGSAAGPAAIDREKMPPRSSRSSLHGTEKRAEKPPLRRERIATLPAG